MRSQRIALRLHNRFMVRNACSGLTRGMSSTSRIGATNELLQPLNAARQACDVASEPVDVFDVLLALRERVDVRATSGARHEDAFALQLADGVVNRDLGDAVRLPKLTERGQLRADLVLTVPHSLPDVLGDLLVKRGRVVSADHASKVTTNALVCVEALTSLIALVHASAHQGNVVSLYGRHHTMETDPTHSDLAEIEAEMPLIAAGVDLVDAECRVLTNPADVLAKRAHRRAMSALLLLLVQQANHDAALAVAPVYTLTHLSSADPAEAA